MWDGEAAAAIEVYGRALAAADSDDVRELITIRKAEALIATDTDGAEVSALPAIVLRRRSARHVYHAASALMRKYSEAADDRKRALFYGEIACEAAEQLGDSLPRVHALNGLGVVRVIESHFSDAIALFEQALGVIDGSTDSNARLNEMHSIVLGNLGGAKVLSGHIDDGIRILEDVLPHMDESYLVTEVCLDLCFGHIERGEFDVAERYGQRALELATIRRQVRNANHLLGEICVRSGRYDDADGYFDVVASYYPEFKNVKQLLVAVDLCSVVNWKA
jgi:tetratricopeptide (TPR) repeat protein